MVEVFRTNIDTEGKACFILGLLETAFPQCRANFDLEDCDNILRLETVDGGIDANAIMTLIEHHGHAIAILPDIVIPSIQHTFSK